MSLPHYLAIAMSRSRTVVVPLALPVLAPLTGPLLVSLLVSLNKVVSLD
jgi:hypothetical protein